jgi:hypothetical protein
VGVAQAYIIAKKVFLISSSGATPTPALPTTGREKKMQFERLLQTSLPMQGSNFQLVHLGQNWIPAFAGMTASGWGKLSTVQNYA